MIDIILAVAAITIFVTMIVAWAKSNKLSLIVAIAVIGGLLAGGTVIVAYVFGIEFATEIHCMLAVDTVVGVVLLVWGWSMYMKGGMSDAYFNAIRKHIDHNKELILKVDGMIEKAKKEEESNEQ